MKRKRFLIPSLFAAGFGAQHEALATTVPLTTGGDGDQDRATLYGIFKQGHAVSLAQHRSHSSHSSHRSGGGGHYSHSSHSSHRSSTGGYDGTYTAPLYDSPAPASPSPPPPATPTRYVPLRSAQPGEATPPPADAVPSLSGRSERFKSIVKRVQIALLAQGFYQGAIDGVVGPGLRSSIRRFQGAKTLPITGTITAEVLDALRVSSE